MADLRTWAFQSPRRLALLIGVPVGAILVVGSLLSLHGKSTQGNESLNAAPASSVHADVPNAQPFVTAAVDFVRVWARLAPGQTASQWHDAVRALATPELATALDLTDPASLPDSAPSGKPSVVDVTGTDAIVAIPLANGSKVLVTVVVDGKSSWLIRDIQPDVGN